MLSQYELTGIVHYSRVTGEFTWVDSGERAELKTPDGYLIIYINKRYYFAHRLAYLYAIGRFPLDVVDHINGIRTDNRTINIRDVTTSLNGKNTKLRKGNNTGLSGVIYNRNKWRVTLGSGGVLYQLGLYGDLFEACCARKSAEIGLGFHENHGR